MASYDEALQKMYAERLTTFYKHYDEAKVASVGTLLAKYKGKEEQLLAAMVKKYGPEPEPGDDDAGDGDEAETDEDEEDDPRVAPGKAPESAAAEDLEDEPEPEPESDGEDKVPVYLPMSLGGLPPEYCEHSAEYDRCVVWIKENCPHLLPRADDDAADGDGDKKKSQRRGGGVIKKKKVDEDKQKVIISKEVRNKKKAVTTVEGLETLGVKLKDAAKLFGKKFAASSSVKEKDTGGQEIVIQGDVIWDLPALLEKEYKIARSKIFERQKGGKLAKVR